MLSMKQQERRWMVGRTSLGHLNPVTRSVAELLRTTCTGSTQKDTSLTENQVYQYQVLKLYAACRSSRIKKQAGFSTTTIRTEEKEDTNVDITIISITNIPLLAFDNHRIHSSME